MASTVSTRSWYFPRSDGRQCPEGNRGQQPEQACAEREREGRRQPSADLLKDVEALGVGVRVAGEDVPHGLDVLDPDRLVEAVTDADQMYLGRGGQPSGDQRRGVAAGQRDDEQQERDERDHEQQQHGQEQPSCEKAAHQLRTRARGSRASRTPSPKILIDITVRTSMIPGIRTEVERGRELLEALLDDRAPARRWRL